MTTRPIDYDSLVLKKGNHKNPDDGLCVMEAAAFVAGEPHSDSPACVAPTIAAFCRLWNDALDDVDRQMLKPIIPLSVGTNTGNRLDEDARAWLATDWLVRTFAPAWLRRAGLTPHADALAALPSLSSSDLARQAQKIIESARAAARDAAGAAAGDYLQSTVTTLQQSAIELYSTMTGGPFDAA